MGLVAALVAAALCMRAPITGVGSLISLIVGELGLAGDAAGMVTTIPLLVFAVVSVLVGGMTRRFGAGHLMLTAAVAVATGLVLRSAFGVTGLFVGTAIIAVGIAIFNVLVPAMIKAFFPDRIWGMTTMYTTVMSVCSGISGGISVPVARVAGWQGALGVWLIAALLAVVCWIPYRKASFRHRESPMGIASVVRSSTAWWITLYMGVQSLLFYSFVAWFATILQARGYTAEAAGWINSFYLLLGMLGSLLLPLLASRIANKSVLGLGIGALYLIAFVGVMFLPPGFTLLIAVFVIGTCQGVAFSYTMAMFGLRTHDADAAAAISSMAQTIGYLLAAVGPVLVGGLFELTGGWTVPLVFLLGCIGVLTVLGILTGRERYIGE